MPRPGAASGEHKPLEVRPLTGGLEASKPPHLVQPSESPDLLNVVLSNSGVEKRGGFIPVIKEHAYLSALKNRGHHGRMRIQNTGTAADSDVLIVPGAAYAGHRQVWESLNLGLAVEMFVRIDDLTQFHVGNQRSNALGEVYYTANDTTPYRIRVRPIFSKGPAKRWYDGDLQNGPVENATVQWRIPASPGGVSYWGPGATEACMPVCIYLHQDNSGTWEFWVAWHSIFTATGATDLLRIRMPAATLTPHTDTTYHIIFSHQHGSTAVFRIGQVTDRNTLPTYYTATSIIDGAGAAVTYSNYRAPTTVTPGPIQVFDCPQEFIAAPTARSLARPPGLGYSSATDGDYWFACKRFEGSIEDIAVWSTHKLAGSNSALDRFLKLDLDNVAQTDIANYWSMASAGTNYVREETGRGNHLYLLPGGPVFDDTLGSPRSGTSAAWWFNGQTSYVLADLMQNPVATPADSALAPFQTDGLPNWRYRLNRPDTLAGAYTRESGFFQRVVLGNYGHGIEVVCWPDALESRFESVLMEIHGVLRLTIDYDGYFTGYCRTNTTGASLTYLYQAPGGGAGHNYVKSPVQVVPGKRYSVALFRDNGGTTLRLYVNGVQVATNTVVANSADGWLLSGITFGMGAFALNAYTNQAAGAYPSPGSVTSPNSVSMDPRTGFIGRIESARILVGQGAFQPTYKDENDTDYQIPQKLLWRIPNSTVAPPNTIVPESDNGEEYPANLTPAHGFVIAGKTVPIRDSYFREKELLMVHGNTTTNSVVTVAPNIADAEDYGFPIDPAGGENGYRVRHAQVHTYATLARWVFDKDDGQANYSGNYQIQLESRLNGTAGVDDQFRSTHVQLSVVEDEVRVLQHVQRRCIESDHMSISYNGSGTLGTPEISLRHSGRPYHFKSPRELAPTWAPGIVRPLTYKTPVSLIAEWQHQKSSESFLVFATGRNIYWAKPVWRDDSPFVEDFPHSLWSFGLPGDYCKTLCSASQQEFRKNGGNYTTVTIDCWVKPQRIDGKRMLVFKGDVVAARCNYAIAFIDGALTVFGGAGANTRVWVYREGDFTGATYRPTVTLKANTWNHVYVMIGSNTITGAGSARVDGWINGTHVPMAADPNYDAITSAAPDGANYALYTMGLPDYQSTVILTGALGTWANQWKSWHGMLTELRITNAEEAAFFSGAGWGYPKRTRYADSASTYLLLHCNEGQDWNLANSAALTSATDNGAVLLRETMPIQNDDEPLEDSSNHRYDWVVFRDELLLTNGKSDPQRISFTSFSDPKGPFRRYRLGIQAPFSALGGAISYQVTVAGPPDLNVWDTSATYDMWLSFVNDNDDESEPTQIARYVYFSGGTRFAGWRITHLPRSPDPQVTKRRIYISPVGGGTPLLHTELNDNESYDTAVYGAPDLGSPAIEIATKLPAPKARHITVGGGTVFLGYLTEYPAGSNAFSFNTDSIAYYPVYNTVQIDSTTGKAITGFMAHLGRLYIFKRDSTWQFALQGAGNPAEAETYLQPISESIGLPGALVSFDNLLYGGGERGLYAFDGANHIYLSKSLKDDYQTFDLDDDAILNMFGAFERPNSQYIVSMRHGGKRYNEFAYVLHTAIGDNQAWTKLRLPPHTYMQSALLPDTQSPGVLIGTIHGQILKLDQSTIIDGHGDTLQYGQTTMLAGSVSSGTTTSLTAVAAPTQSFDSIGDGLRGVTLRINGVDRVIERVLGTTLYWREPLTSAATGNFYVGAYEAYYTSGWVDPQVRGQWLETKFLELDFAPSNCGLTVENHVANTISTNRAFPGGAESRVVNLTTGYMTQPVPTLTQNHGRYMRVKFSANLQRDPFLITGWHLRFTDTGIRGQPT